MSSPLNEELSTPWELPGMGYLRRTYSLKKGARGNHVTPLPYTRIAARSDGYVQVKSNGYYMVIDAPNFYGFWEFETYGGIPPWARPAFNRAYAKFKDKAVGDNASIGVFAAEMRESLGMITGRALSLYRAAKNLKQGKLDRAIRDLGVKPKRKHKGKSDIRPEAAAETWLEYWFGWKPFVSDFFSTAEAMSKPLPGGIYHAGAADTCNDIVDHDGMKHYRHRKIYARVGAEVYLENPNEFLLQSLGLANPASVAWELIPFSFLVDWLTGAGSYLESYTDFYGCSVINPYYTAYGKFEHQQVPYHWNYTGGPMTARGFGVKRYASLYQPVPNLQITANLKQSLTRTATAVSLLTTTLSSMAGRPR